MTRRLIPELVTRYRLEPTLRDIYVEGPSDKTLVAWFLRRVGAVEAKVFEIDLVDVSVELLSRYGLKEGRKQRLLALAQELEKAVGLGMEQATCVVDKDTDTLLGGKFEGGIALRTDFSCMEMYLFDEVHLGKFFQLTLGVNEDVRRVLKEYGKVLNRIFVIRAAADYLHLPIRFLDFTTCCTYEGSAISIDMNEFRRRVLDGSALRAEEGRLAAEIERLGALISGDSRSYVNGEDILWLLQWDQRDNLRKRDLRSEKAVEAALRGCLEFDVIAVHKLFQIMKARTVV